MTRLPKGFALNPSRSQGAYEVKPVPPPISRTGDLVKDKSPGKHHASSNTANLSKKSNSLDETLAAMAADYEKHVLLHVEQKEVDVWKALSKEQARDAVRRATTELFFYNVIDESMRTDDLARSHTLELEKARLLKELKEGKKAIESLNNAKSVLKDSLKIHSLEKARLKKELQNK